MISTYLSVAQLDLPENLIAEQLSNLEQNLAESALPSVRWQYQIPELGEGVRVAYLVICKMNHSN